MSQERARSFGSVAEEYEATRPGWPLDPFTRVFEHFDVRPRPDIAEIAAGTGKLTRTLARVAGTLVAVEPDDDLRAVLQRVLPDVEAVSGTAEEIPLAAGSADVVCAGQAFHWFDVDRALAETRRVLRPRGIVIAGWNTPPEEGTWYDAVIDFLHVSNPDHLPATTRDWDDTFSGQTGYGDLYAISARHEQPSDRVALARLLATHSALIVQPPERRAALIERAITVAGEQGAFDADGSCAIPWRCELYALQRR